MKWMKDPLAGFISRCGARMGKFTALLVTIAMLAGTTGAGATAFADETVTDGGNVAAESAASQPESTQQSDAENAVGSDVADIAGQDVAGQSATDDDDAQCAAAIERTSAIATAVAIATGTTVGDDAGTAAAVR